MTLKVLALHGFGQNAEVFIEKRAKELCRKLKAVATLHAIDAPYTLKYDTSLRGWFTYNEKLWDGRGETIQALAEALLQCDEVEGVGLSDSFQSVLDEWNKGCYDGILGFSQGAILATALCSELHARGKPPRFAIIVSGYGKPLPRGVSCYPPSQPLPVPSLHIWGAADDHIPPWASQMLAGFFEAPKTHAHPGGHFMPQKSPDIAIIQEFLDKFLSPDASAPSKASKSKPQGKTQEHPDSMPEQASKSMASERQSPEASSLHLASCDELSVAVTYYAACGMCCQLPEPTQASNIVASTGASATSTSSGYLPEELDGPGMDTHERLLALLQKNGIEFQFLGPHAACHTSEDSVKVRLEGGWEGTTLHSGAKAMLLQTAKSGWCLAVLPADRKLSWKKVRAVYGKATRMAKEEEVREVTGCVPGAVPPFAAAFPVEAKCIVDPDLPDTINFNCGSRYRSIRMTKSDFASIQAPEIFDICE